MQPHERFWDAAGAAAWWRAASAATARIAGGRRKRRTKARQPSATHAALRELELHCSFLSRFCSLYLQEQVDSV